MTPEQFRKLERETFSNKTITQIEYEPAEMGERLEGYIPDPHFEALKDPPQKDLEWLDKHFPRLTDIPKVVAPKSTFKPQSWSIKQRPHVSEDAMLEALETEELEPPAPTL